MGVFDNDNTLVLHKPLVPIKELKKVPQGYMLTANGTLIRIPALLSIGSAPVKTRFAKEIDKRRGEIQLWKEEELKKKLELAEAIEAAVKMALPSTYIGPLFNNNGKSYTDNLLSGEGTGDWENNLAIDLITPFAIKLTPSMIKPRFFKVPKVLNQESTHNIIEGAKIINGNANIDKLQKAGLFNPSENTLYVKHVASPNLYKVIGSTDKYYDDVIYDIFDRVEKLAPKDFLTNLQINLAVKDVVNNKTYYINDLENPLNGWFVPANNFGKGKSIINVSAPIGDEELLGALIHERYMHPTERIVERLKLHKPYKDFLEEIGLNKELWNEFRAELGHLKYVNLPEVNAFLEELLKHFYPSSSGANVFKDAINNTIKNNPELKLDITNKLKFLITTVPSIIPAVIDNKESKYQEGGQIIAPTDAISSLLLLTPIGGLVPYEIFAPKILAKLKPRYRYNRHSPQFLIPTEDYSIKLDDRELEYNNGSWFEIKSGNRKYIMYPRDYLFYDPNKKARFVLDSSGRVIINQPATPVKKIVSDNANLYNLPKLHNANTSR